MNTADIMLGEVEWNFGKVPDAELVACCYWEYARESLFLRQLRTRCVRDRSGAGKRAMQLHRDVQAVQSIGAPAYFFLRGFFFPPDEKRPPEPGKVRSFTGCFPRPWQMITPQERECRSKTTLLGMDEFPEIVPIRRGSWAEAMLFTDVATTQRHLRDAASAKVRRENPRVSEMALDEGGKVQDAEIEIPPSILYESGRECTAVVIDWGSFTNEEILQAFRLWVKENRPADVRSPDRRGLNKARDWRVALERLAMMRLLHHCRPRDLPHRFPKVWKMYEKREWYKERTRAGAMFRRLFPFLPSSERPLSWPTEGGHSK